MADRSVQLIRSRAKCGMIRRSAHSVGRMPTFKVMFDGSSKSASDDGCNLSAYACVLDVDGEASEDTS